ncbi:MAG TPA: site-specific integrase [Thermodesulfovibrionales bacterium]|nr:site-specific integrase [Thermodesulfovibrionales bacterium]
MGLFRKNKIWYFAIMRDGRRIQKSTGTSNKMLAKRIYEQTLAEVVKGKWFRYEQARRISFKSLVEKYTNRYQRKRDPVTIKPLLAFFGDKTLADIAISDVENYVLERMKSPKKLSHATIYQEYSLGRRIFNVARKTWQMVESNPFGDFDYKELLDTDNPRKRSLSLDEEIQLLHNAHSNDIGDFIVASVHSGCRRGEVLSWDWHETVDLSNRVLTVRVSKRIRKKVVYKHIPMTEILYKILLRRSKIVHISGKVFPMDIHDVRYAFDETVKRAGIKNTRLHDLRRTFSTRLDECQVPLHIIKVLMGHSMNNDVTETHYINRVAESLRPYILLLDKYYEKHGISLDDVLKRAG